MKDMIINIQDPPGTIDRMKSMRLTPSNFIVKLFKDKGKKRI